ncbi:hypothetical protein VNO77_35123 [Canavalia gladiata]|uniref:Uncharacterized protein n=1 Tax=Canavalia gladiata TaxID=3824 RepID=A0AAN9KFT1_CANGL
MRASQSEHRYAESAWQYTMHAADRHVSQTRDQLLAPPPLLLVPPSFNMLLKSCWSSRFGMVRPMLAAALPFGIVKEMLESLFSVMVTQLRAMCHLGSI